MSIVCKIFGHKMMRQNSMWHAKCKRCDYEKHIKCRPQPMPKCKPPLTEGKVKKGGVGVRPSNVRPIAPPPKGSQNNRLEKNQSDVVIKISKSAIGISQAFDISVMISITCIINFSPYKVDTRKEILKECIDWIYDNQNYYGLSVSRADVEHFTPQ